MRVVIVDDEPLARERLRRLVGEFPGYEVVGEAGDGETALDVIDDEQPDIVFLDIRMGGMDGLQVARQLTDVAEIVRAAAEAMRNAGAGGAADMPAPGSG